MIIQHANGQFRAELTNGLAVVRRVQYPEFVYERADGLSARHPIGYGGGRGSIEVDELGVHFCDTGGVQKTFPWA